MTFLKYISIALIIFILLFTVSCSQKTTNIPLDNEILAISGEWVVQSSDFKDIIEGNLSLREDRTWSSSYQYENKTSQSTTGTYQVNTTGITFETKKTKIYYPYTRLKNGLIIFYEGGSTTYVK